MISHIVYHVIALLLIDRCEFGAVYIFDFFTTTNFYQIQFRAKDWDWTLAMTRTFEWSPQCYFPIIIRVIRVTSSHGAGEQLDGAVTIDSTWSFKVEVEEKKKEIILNQLINREKKLQNKTVQRKTDGNSGDAEEQVKEGVKRRGEGRA